MRDRQVVLELPELEQRLSNLQTQVERLWRKAESNVPPIEQRLASMADQYAEYLKRWAETVERHTSAVAQLEAYASEWRDASSRARQETADRLHELETTIEREWDTLKQMQAQPIRELREQAESLSQVSLAMANASQQGVERAEARFAAFETEVHLRLNELTRELTTAVAEMKTRLDRLPASRDPSAQWSLDDVTRLHGQLREGSARGRDQFPHTIDHSSVSPRELPPTAAREFADTDRDPLTISSRPTPGTHVETSLPQKWIAAVVLLGAVVVAGILGWRMQGQIKDATERAAIAEQKATVAVTEQARQADEARRETERQLAETRDLGLRMQRTSNVLSAPDLIRFNLFGANGASGQAMVSRSRGVIVNASNLPDAPASVLVAWLLTPTSPVKVGLLEAEEDGLVTLAVATPVVPRRFVGMMVTAETSETADIPVGAQVLSSIRPEPAQPPAEAQP